MIKLEVNEGKTPWIVGIITILFGISYGVLCTMYPDKSAKGEVFYYLLVYPVAVLIILAGVWLCLDAKNRKLVVEDATLCYTNSFGRKSSFLLSDIAYCSTALENGGNRDFLKLYNEQDKKLCKLEYNMRDCAVFLQYLIDNQVKIECSEKSDYMLKSMLNMTSVSTEEIAGIVNNAYQDAKGLIRKWLEENSKLGVEWKMGIVTYLENEIEEKKQLWEQTSCGVVESSSVNLPEGYIIAIEGYLLKDGEFVINKKNGVVGIFATVIRVSKSLKIGEKLKISNFTDVSEELFAQLTILAEILPRNRYHTEALVLNHELRDSL
ncbi:MAG: hypothetical protein K2H31_03765 [Lachnospiraceae bacterium]|nr:hypothetical protein [Lachnospiraceae bacterium]